MLFLEISAKIYYLHYKLINLMFILLIFFLLSLFQKKEKQNKKLLVKLSVYKILAINWLYLFFIQ